VNLNLGTVIRADLTLTPEVPLVNDIQVNLQTQSLPRLIIEPLEARLEAELALFHGLPVRFLEKYQDRVLAEVEKALQDQGWGKYIYLSQKPKLVIGSTTSLDLHVEWIDYQIEMIGEVSLGLNAPSPAFYLSLGKRLGTRTIFKVQDVFTFQRPTGTLSVSLERRLSDAFTAKVQYGIRDANWRATLDWRKNRYGITFSQPVPGGMGDGQVSLHYALATHSEVSLVYEKENLWVTLRQTF
jgi:hypothetical protein